MKSARRLALCAVAAALLGLPALAQPGADAVRVESGTIVGAGRQASGVRIFRGVPYARPPVGALRWTAPQPAQPWTGVRTATEFGAACMQKRVFADMVFRGKPASEDCLYLNIWTPAKRAGEKLPVLVYFYGGGYIAGDGSEPRYDGEATATKGVVVVNLNYRLGVFGFMARPELTAESSHKASGDYGLLDQAAALRWVKANIAAFGGDPNHITIGGESAGSFSVSAQMASPLSRGLIAGAIGESGSLVGLAPTPSRADAERNGVAFGEKIGAPTLAQLRALPGDQLLELASQPGVRFGPSVDGYFFPKPPAEIYAAGEEARVPLLAGSNTQEQGADAVLGKDGARTLAAYRAALQTRFGAKADAILAAYPATSDAEVEDAAQALGGDLFIGYSTWKWVDLHRRTGAPTYYYLYARPRPATVEAGPAPARGAVHSAEIEYALGNLDLNKVFAWTPEDRATSANLQGYFVNFIKTGDPNGAGLPRWPATGAGATYARMVVDSASSARTAAEDARYHGLEAALRP